MRFERLDLLCYGHFQGKTIDFPVGEGDFHIIYGANEAGKSTALCAIEDLIFGFPTKSNYNFMFENKDLRVGAVIENDYDKKKFEFRRRKGTRDTILGENDTPITDKALDNFLQGIDRSFFERMFSLGHERLRKGGKEILDKKDDVGRMLFSASSGLQGITEVLRKLEERAAEHWSSRKSGQRLYYKAEDSFKDAEKRKREATILSSYWKEKKEKFENFSEEHSFQNRLYAEKTAQFSKFQRILRILPHFVQVKDLEKEISKFERMPNFPENASEVMEVAVNELNQADIALLNLTEQIADVKKDLGCITLDKKLLRLEDKIKKLKNDLAVVEKSEADIPARLAEIKTLEKKRSDLAAELNWIPEKIQDENFFPQTLYQKIEKLKDTKEALDTRLESAKDSLKDSKTRYKNLQDEITQLGKKPDITFLETSIHHVREKRNLEAEIIQNKDEISNLKRKIENRLKALQPWNGSVESLEKLLVPQNVTIERFNKEIKDINVSQKEMSSKRETIKQQLSEYKLEKEQLLRNKKAISFEQLKEARQRRDIGWNIIHRKYLKDEDVSKDEVIHFSDGMTLSEAFERSTKIADSLADNRFDYAEEAAKLSELARMMELLENRLKEFEKKENGLQRQKNEFNERWQSVWKNCTFEPISPEEMLDWADRRIEILDDYNNLLICLQRADNLKAQEEEARVLLFTGLNQVDCNDQEKNQSLGLLLEHAEKIKSDLDKKTTRIEELIKQALVAKDQELKTKEKYDDILTEKREWEQKWLGAMKEAGFSQSSSVEEIRFNLNAIKQIKDNGQEISKIRITRIEAMSKDIERFNEEVGRLLEGLNINIENTDYKEAFYSLTHHLDEERSKKSSKENQEKNLKALEIKKLQKKENRETALAKLQPLFKEAGMEDLFTLKKQVAAFDRLRDNESKKEGVLVTLLNQGDGKSRDELEKECQGLDADCVKQELALLEKELIEINLELQKLSEQKSEVKAEVDKISGKEDAAVAEVDRQLALTDMGISVEQYIKAQTASMLLQWGMEKFRKEKQGPLLERGSEIFKILTIQKYSKLTVELDDKDNPILVGVRGEKFVEVESMSDGTVDQLYLAIRLAAIEEYIQSSQPLPLVVDDLFINFDDERAVAGLKVLRNLASKTQVLFFTHHRHLVELAKSTFGKENICVHNI